MDAPLTSPWTALSTVSRGLSNGKSNVPDALDLGVDMSMAPSSHSPATHAKPKANLTRMDFVFA